MIYILKIRKIRKINSIISTITKFLKNEEYKQYFKAILYTRKIAEYIFVETDDIKKFVYKLGSNDFTILKDIVNLDELKETISKLDEKIDSNIKEIKEGDLVKLNKPGFKANSEAIVKGINYKTRKAIVKLVQAGSFPFSITIDISNLVLFKSKE